MSPLERLQIKIYADGADRDGILAFNAKPYIRGITTNPTLMRKAGVEDYEAFARDILQHVVTKPLSLEVLSDDFAEMERQARKIASWGPNVFVKIPITNSRGESSAGLLRSLGEHGVKINVTAILTVQQVETVAGVLNPAVPSIVSIFSGRIADTGIDPAPVVRASRLALSHLPHAELLWASVREVLNLVQAAEAGCDIVTVTHDILSRAERLLDMDHAGLSLETVRMFARDAAAAGYRL